MGKTVSKTIDELCPMDDIFFEKLASHSEFCEEILQTILVKKDLSVVTVEPQKSIRNIEGRSVILDVFDKGKTIYHIDRVIRETGDVVDNGFHEIYVNTFVNDKSDIADLMQMFESPKMILNEKFPRVCDTIRYYKDGKGREYMCNAIEELKQEAAKETMKLIVSNMLKAEKSDTEIMQITGLAKTELEAMKAEIFELV